MKTFQGIEISDNEFNNIKKCVKLKGITYNDTEILDNLIIDKDNHNYWNLRISKVSARDLPKHNNRYFTDGNNNGKTLLIKRVNKLK